MKFIIEGDRFLIQKLLIGMGVCGENLATTLLHLKPVGGDRGGMVEVEIPDDTIVELVDRLVEEKVETTTPRVTERDHAPSGPATVLPFRRKKGGC